MPRILLQRRWLALLLFVVIFGAVCFRLGLWQWHRHDDRIERNAVTREHFREDPRPIDDVVPRGQSVADRQEWIRVSATGRYDAAAQVSVRFTPRDSTPGVDVVTPLRLADGTAVLVDRGWMESTNTVERPDLPAPPAGEVTVTGWLRPDNGAGGNAVRVIDGQVRAVASDGFAKSVSYPVRSGFVNLRTESPQGPQLAPEPEPDLGQGPHFFYALQWWFFGLLGVVGLGWFARDELRAAQDQTRT